MPCEYRMLNCATVASLTCAPPTERFPGKYSFAFFESAFGWLFSELFSELWLFKKKRRFMQRAGGGGWVRNCKF